MIHSAGCLYLVSPHQEQDVLSWDDPGASEGSSFTGLMQLMEKPTASAPNSSATQVFTSTCSSGRKHMADVRSNNKSCFKSEGTLRIKSTWDMLEALWEGQNPRGTAGSVGFLSVTIWMSWVCTMSSTSAAVSCRGLRVSPKANLKNKHDVKSDGMKRNSTKLKIIFPKNWKNAADNKTRRRESINCKSWAAELKLSHLIVKEKLPLTAHWNYYLFF